MEIRSLGSSGLNVPVVGMGTWQTLDVRGAPATSNRKELVRHALDIGVRFFDTSPMYGASEALLGAALTHRRREAIVATKVWASSADQGTQQTRNALSVYGGRVDLYQIHNLLAWKEHIPLLQQLWDDGKVGAIGITHYAHSSFPELITAMKSRKFSVVQVPYNPLDQRVEDQILPLARDLNMGVIVMLPFAEGRLTRKGPEASRMKPFRDNGVETWAQVVLKWILSNPDCHVAIPATTRMDHLDENARAGSPPWFDPGLRREVIRLARRL